MDATTLPVTVQKLLQTLLERAEQPTRQRVIRARLNERDHPHYFSPEDAAPRHEAHTVLGQLVANGTLNLRWKKWEEGNWLDAVDLVPERLADVYAILGRQPHAAQIAELQALLDQQTPHPGWHASFLAFVQAQLEAGRSPAPLVLGDDRLNTALLRAFAAIATLSAPVLERTLSTRIFGDSKRLEMLRGALINALRRHDVGAATFDEDWVLLRAHGLERTPEYIPMAGAVVLRVPQTHASISSLLDLALFQPSVGLSAAMLRKATVVACDARIVVTVENSTSFNELLAVRPRDVVALYTGGFASPAVINLLRTLRMSQPNLTHVHWGDIDVGGLRILGHLRDQLGAVTTLAMDAATLRAHQASARLLVSSERSALAVLKGHPALADCGEIIDTMLELGIKLEQEALDAGSILTHL